MHKTSTSIEEMILLYYIKRFFPDSIHRHRINTSNGKKYEVDIFIPCIKVAIEYDGRYWHRDKYSFDVEKTNALNDIGLYVIHIREIGLKSLLPYYGEELWHKARKSDKGLYTNEFVTKTINSLSKFCSGKVEKALSSYVLSYEQFKLDLPTINSMIYDTPVSDPVSEKPAMIYWDSQRNGALNPSFVPYGVDIRVFLKCPAEKVFHVNVTLACQHDYPSAELGKYICILFGNNDFCVNRCETFVQQIKQCIDNIKTIKSKVGERDYLWLQRTAFNNDDIICYILEKLVKDEISDNVFSDCFLTDESFRYFLNSGQIKISKPETLVLVKKAQEKVGFFWARFNPLAFDLDDYSREVFFDYLIFALCEIDCRWQATYLWELFCGILQQKELPSNIMRDMLRTIKGKFSIQSIAPSMDQFLT